MDAVFFYFQQSFEEFYKKKICGIKFTKSYLDVQNKLTEIRKIKN